MDKRERTKALYATIHSMLKEVAGDSCVLYNTHEEISPWEVCESCSKENGMKEEKELQVVKLSEEPKKESWSDELKSFRDQVERMVQVFHQMPSLLRLTDFEYKEDSKDVVVRFHLRMLQADLFVDLEESTLVVKQYFYWSLDNHAKEYLGLNETFPSIQWNNTKLIGRIRINKKAFITWLVEHY